MHALTSRSAYIRQDRTVVDRQEVTRWMDTRLCSESCDGANINITTTPKNPRIPNGQSRRDWDSSPSIVGIILPAASTHNLANIAMYTYLHSLLISSLLVLLCILSSVHACHPVKQVADATSAPSCRRVNPKLMHDQAWNRIHHRNNPLCTSSIRQS